MTVCPHTKQSCDENVCIVVIYIQVLLESVNGRKIPNIYVGKCEKCVLAKLNE